MRRPLPVRVRRVALAIIVSAVSAAVPTRGGAQDQAPRCRVRGSHKWLATRASPLDSATLATGGAVAKICYSRPSARGRPVYDSLAPFGKAWRTGANEPTILELTAPATVGGASLMAGRYAILTVPGASAWIVLFHSFPETDDAGRIFQQMTAAGRGIALAERVSPPVDRFVIRAVDDAGGLAFLLEWGTLRSRLPVTFGR